MSLGDSPIHIYIPRHMARNVNMNRLIHLRPDVIAIVIADVVVYVYANVIINRYPHNKKLRWFK